MLVVRRVTVAVDVTANDSMMNMTRAIGKTPHGVRLLALLLGAPRRMLPQQAALRRRPHRQKLLQQQPQLLTYLILEMTSQL